MIYVLHKDDVPTHLMFKAPDEVKAQSGVWFVIMNGAIYSRWINKENAESEAEGLVRYFS